MKFKATLLVLFVFSCICVTAQQANTARQNAPTVTELNAEIQQLQSANAGLEKQFEALEKEVELFREDVRQKSAELNSVLHDDMSHWFDSLSIVVTVIVIILGVAVPLIINNNHQHLLKEHYDNELKNLKQQFHDSLAELHSNFELVSGTVQNAEKAAKLAEDLKTEFIEIKEMIVKDSKEAKKAAQEAKASQYFTEAFTEKDPSKQEELYAKAIELNPGDAVAYHYRGIAKYNKDDYLGAIEDYNKAIELDPTDSLAYYYRGNAKYKLGSNLGAIDDFDKAIELDPRRARFYRNRAYVYKRLAEAETNEAKKNEYLAKADSDQKMGEALA